MNTDLPVSPAILKKVADLDHFRGVWAGGRVLPSGPLKRLRDAARIQSVTASCRLAGIHVTETEVAALISGTAVPFSEGREILGYVTALETPFPGEGHLLSTERLRMLHAAAMGKTDQPEPTPWRSEPYHLELFDENGQAMGRVFQTLPPRLIDETMEELVTWLELELREGKNHPVPVIATFVLFFVATCPFPRGNGRVAHLLSNHLLTNAGYDFMPFVSLERIFEEQRDSYFQALDRAQTGLWSGEADLQPWLDFFLDSLGRHRERLQSRIDLEQQELDFTPLQRKILETVRNHGTVAAGMFLKATGANRNTLKDNLRRLVDRGVLERLGERRGTRYRLATTDPLANSTGGSGPDLAG